MAKKSSKWRMCTNFMDLTKACPGDTLPFIEYWSGSGRLGEGKWVEDGESKGYGIVVNPNSNQDVTVITRLRLHRLWWPTMLVVSLSRQQSTELELSLTATNVCNQQQMGGGGEQKWEVMYWQREGGGGKEVDGRGRDRDWGVWTISRLFTWTIFFGNGV